MILHGFGLLQLRCKKSHLRSACRLFGAHFPIYPRFRPIVLHGVRFLPGPLFYILHNYSKPGAISKLSGAVNRESILNTYGFVNNSSTWWRQFPMLTAIQRPSPSVRLPFPNSHTVSCLHPTPLQLCPYLKKLDVSCKWCASPRLAATVIKSAVSANGIITVLINLSNLPHLFLLLYTSSSKFSICLCSTRFEIKAWQKIPGVSTAGDLPGKVWYLLLCQTWGQALRIQWLGSHLIFSLAA